MNSKGPPPAYTASSQQPPAGLRVPCTTGHVDNKAALGQAPFVDLDGAQVYVCSALLEGGKSVHPAKYVRGQVMVSFGGSEFKHEGRFDVLPITQDMEWVATSHGRVPKGRRPVEGGFEENGSHLFHAMTLIGEVPVPGKTGSHLNGANFPWGGGEHVVSEHYSILCWK
ncbi:hypothetical protein OIO90_003932 [Microbotryomycetes sp. JL221]|nr:hypothetical protein OIO90_003932 [Microbotryomycetes sp. JL221]